MLNLFNSLGKRVEEFVPANASVTNIFTCGPSVYQRPHIGNYRTFLFEDILVRYLEYCGFRVTRGMNFTDIEDKAVDKARECGATEDEIWEAVVYAMRPAAAKVRDLAKEIIAQ